MARLAALLVFFAFALANSCSYEDAKAEQGLYCANVEAGTWPDYRAEEKLCEAQAQAR